MDQRFIVNICHDEIYRRRAASRVKANARWADQTWDVRCPRINIVVSSVTRMRRDFAWKIGARVAPGRGADAPTIASQFIDELGPSAPASKLHGLRADMPFKTYGASAVITRVFVTIFGVLLDRRVTRWGTSNWSLRTPTESLASQHGNCKLATRDWRAKLAGRGRKSRKTFLGDRVTSR